MSLLKLKLRSKRLDKKIRQLCRQNDTCCRLLAIPGVGELTATAMVAAVPNANEFTNGRHHMAAWLGLGATAIVQWTTNKYCWASVNEVIDICGTLLIHGARSALSHYKNTDSDYGRWLTTKKEKAQL